MERVELGVQGSTASITCHSGNASSGRQRLSARVTAVLQVPRREPATEWVFHKYFPNREVNWGSEGSRRKSRRNVITSLGVAPLLHSWGVQTRIQNEDWDLASLGFARMPGQSRCAALDGRGVQGPCALYGPPLGALYGVPEPCPWIVVTERSGPLSSLSQFPGRIFSVAPSRQGTRSFSVCLYLINVQWVFGYLK